MQRSVGLTMRKLCGELECPKYHLCLVHDLQCYPCQSYCNETSNNFDVNICEKQCQGALIELLLNYIHDYIHHYVKADDIQDSLQDLEFLKLWTICLTVLMVVVLILMCIILMFLWNYKRKLNIENRSIDSCFKNKMVSIKFKDNAVSIMNETMDNPVTETGMIAARTTTNSLSKPQAGTTVSASNKLPCEDVSLETQNFFGFDNSGMWKMSPVIRC